MAFLYISSPALALTSEDIQNSYYRSYNYERTHAYDEAIKSLIPVVDFLPRDYTINLRLGWLYYLRAGYADSITYYRRAIDAEPASFEARLGLLYPLLALARTDEAINIVQQILSVDRYNYYANQRLVAILHQNGRLDQAERASRSMLSLLPSDVFFLVELGVIKTEQGDKVAAAETFKNVLLLDPENVVARRYFSANTQ
ncbi:MAG: tetratricopeptide repeat protein [Rhodospirillaceae bacterium]